MSNIVVIESPEQFTQLMQADLERITLLNFWAPWAQPCESVNAAIPALAAQNPSVLFMNIEAEEQPDVAESFDVEAVPTVVILRGHTLLAKVAGANVTNISESLARATSEKKAAPAPTPSYAAPTPGPDGLWHEAPPGLPDVEEPAAIEARCHELMNRSKVMVFMKGHPDQPRCGFSRKTVALLQEQGVQFDHYDILSDEAVRQTLKRLNEWPTFPQIIVNGELIGGLDILTEHIAAGELHDMLK
ncbi:glutaredoxin [Malassezia cuniculi]|uniref:Glutaredoxin n=1 Tax=Malassezia cuniculi TaxID=948313 RepID=A0AAF0JBL1_9BASI|nr:glutaredoxin [Malassezia cuniculi]